MSYAQPNHNLGQSNGSVEVVVVFSPKNNKYIRYAILYVVYATCCMVTFAEGAPRAPKTQRDGLNCTNHVEVIDRCSSMATYSFITAFNSYPKNGDELKKSCDRIGDGLKCLKVQGKCLSNVARRSLQSFQNGRQRHSRKLCSSLDSESAKRFHQTFTCLDKFKKLDFIRSEREIISSIQVITAADMKWKEKFNHACCSASEYKEKALADVGTQCNQYIATAEEMFDSVVGELLESACPEAKRLKEICPTLPKLVLPKGNWKPVSLTGAALDLIVVLADTSKPDD